MYLKRICHDQVRFIWKSKQKKNHTVLAIHTSSVFENRQHPFTILKKKPSGNLEEKGDFLNLIESNYKTVGVRPDNETKKLMCSPLPIEHKTRSSSQSNKAIKVTKGILTGKEKAYLQASKVNPTLDDEATLDLGVQMGKS